jgi:hypothetical protein
LHLREAPQTNTQGGSDERRHDLRPCLALLHLEAHDTELLCSLPLLSCLA